MTTGTGRNCCVTCGKDRATLRCGGCSQEFCLNHLTNHRQELNKQLGEIEVNRDLFRQTLTEQTTHPQTHELIQQIDDWERDSIKTIQQTAEEVKEKLQKYIVEGTEKIEIKLNTLTENLQKSREENDFNETDLNHWNEELTRLKKELSKLSNINLQQHTTPLIYQLHADTSSEPPLVSKWNEGSGSSVSGGFKTFNKNDNDKNSNLNNYKGFGSQNAGRGGRGGNIGGFGSHNYGNSPVCYNCGQTGHMIRECTESRKFNSGGSRGGFNSGSVDRNVNVSSAMNGGNSSMPFSFRNSRSQNADDQDDNSEKKTNFGSWRRCVSNGNDAEHSNGQKTFNDFTFRGGRRDSGEGFNSNDRSINRGEGNGGSNWQNRPGNQYRDFYEERKPRDDHFFNGSGRREDQTFDDISDQPGGRFGAGQSIERYVPPPPPTTEDDIFGQAVSKGENFDKYHRTQVQCIPADKVKPIDFYEEANLDTQILSNIRRAYYDEPTPVQCYTIPCIRQLDDIMACAQSGSGKTAAFLLPIISNLLEYHADELIEKHHPSSPLCLILSPTRELALQTEREARKFAYQTGVRSCSVVGGHDMLTVTDHHILSATTRRLIDMVEKGRISLKKVKYLVLDEIDPIFDTAFESDVRKLEELGLPLKDKRFTSMFSTTFPDEVQKLARHCLRDNCVFLAVGTLGGANEDIEQIIEEVSQANKKERLFQLLEQNLSMKERFLILVETKRSADYIDSLLSHKKLMNRTIHSDRTQKQRDEAVQEFTTGQCRILVATSVAARGLDFPSIGYVINYDLPITSDLYIHSIGRTGRIGHLGKSISFFDPGRGFDREIAPQLITILTKSGQEVPEFLRKYADDANVRFNRGGGSATASAAENEDEFY